MAMYFYDKKHLDDIKSLADLDKHAPIAVQEDDYIICQDDPFVTVLGSRLRCTQVVYLPPHTVCFLMPVNDNET